MNTSEIVNNPDFKEIAVLQQSNIKDFVKRELLNNSGGWATIGNMYQLFGGLLFFLLLTKSTISLIKTSNADNFIAIGVGLLISFTLIVVIHELIHAIAYKLVGAKKVSFGVNIKKFIFHVQVNKQVFNYKQMKFVALAPAVVIFILCTIRSYHFLRRTTLLSLCHDFSSSQSLLFRRFRHIMLFPKQTGQGYLHF